MEQTAVPAVEHWQHIHDILHGYRAAQVMITATQLHLFDALVAGPQTAATLADQIDSEPQALSRLLNAAVAVGLLQKQGERYANTPLAATCLVTDSAYTLSKLVRREGAFYQRWSYLREAVTSGERPEPNIRDEETENWVLDFELATEIIEAEGMANRITVQVGDFQTNELGSDYDLILLFGVLVSETEEGKLQLLRKAYRALASGGTVVARSMWLDEDRAGPYKAALFSLQMLLSNNTGDLSTLSEMEALLDEAGFVDIRSRPLPEWAGTTLCLATKAGVYDDD